MTDTVHPVVGQVLADRPDSPAHPAAKRKATDGRRVLATLVSGVAAGAVGGTAVWFGFRWLAPSVAPSVITQVVVAVVYLTLIASLATPFVLQARGRSIFVSPPSEFWDSRVWHGWALSPWRWWST